MMSLYPNVTGLLTCFFLSQGGPRDNKAGSKPVTYNVASGLKEWFLAVWGGVIKLTGKVFQIV